MNTLENKKIITTRPLSDQDNLKNALSGKGATVLDFPMIEIKPAELSDDHKKIIKAIDAFHWLIFTSKNGVSHFFRIIDNDNLKQPKIAVIGESTAKEIFKNNHTPFFVSTGITSELFLKELKNNRIKTGDSVLLILGELADNTLENGLAGLATIQRLNVYKTIETVSYSETIVEMIREDNYNMIIFTSPSGYRNFSRIMNENNIHKNYRIACIGKTTHKEVLNHGQKPLLVSSKPNAENFVTEIEAYFLKK